MAWNIDPTHSDIEFSVRHLMVSRVRGQFDQWTGSVDIDEEYPERSSVTVQINADSINTKLEDRDAHLRSEDFLNSEEYPYLIFASKQIRKVDDTHFKVDGDLTIRGTTRPVSLDTVFEGKVKSPFGPYYSAGINAETTISRKEWGLTWNAPIEAGGVVVGDEIQISIDLELVEEIEEENLEAVRIA